MPERVDLTVSQTKTTTNYQLRHLSLNIISKQIAVELVSDTGGVITKVYDSTTTPTGATLLSQINASDNRTVSMVRKVYNRLVADGVLAGTVSGTAD